MPFEQQSDRGRLQHRPERMHRRESIAEGQLDKTMETKNKVKVKVIKTRPRSRWIRVLLSNTPTVFVTDLWTTIHIRFTRNSELSRPSDLSTIENTRVIHRQYTDST